MHLQVVSTEVCNPEKLLCNSIAPVHNPSAAVIEVKNTGSETSSYTVSLGECSHPVTVLDSQTLSLESSEISEVVFEVRQLLFKLSALNGFG